MVLTHDSSDTARLIALRLHWIAGVLLALELVTAACKTTEPAPLPPTPPAATPGDNPTPAPAPQTSMMNERGRTHCGWGR
jgi:hypothetical protein